MLGDMMKTNWDELGVDWLAIEQDYVTAKSKMSMRKLADTHFPEGLKKSDTNLRTFWRELQKRAVRSPQGKWTVQRKSYWNRVSAEVLGQKTDDEVMRIRQMREQERLEFLKAIKVSESIVQSLMGRLEDKSGTFLFPDLNEEENLNLFKAWSEVRKRIQDMMYKSYDIADRHDIRTHDDDEAKAAAILERMYGHTPAAQAGT